MAAKTVTPEQLTQIKAIFHELDSDKDGKISVKEMNRAIAKLDAMLEAGGASGSLTIADDADAAMALRLMDGDGNGSIELPEFVDFYTMTLMEDAVGLGKATFRLADTDRDGFVTAAELKAFTRDIDMEMSDEDIEAVFEMGHASKDGKLTYEGFLKAWTARVIDDS